MPGNNGRLFLWISVNSCTNSRKCQALEFFTHSNFKTVSVTGCQQSLFAMLPTLPYRARCVNNKPGSQVKTRRKYSTACRTAVNFDTCLKKARPCCPMDGSIHPAPAPQAGIGSVHDGINVDLGDVAGMNFNSM